VAALPVRALTALIRRLVPGRLARELDRFYAPDRQGATLLDYGCGAPTFLDEARGRGWQTAGADFTEEVLAPVRAHGHDAYLVGDELERGVADGSVGAVRMNHVVEHLYDPAAVMVGIRRKLASGGRIHISTPDPGSLGSRAFRRHWHALDAPRHTVLFRPAVLAKTLRDAGFRDVRVVHEVGPKDLTRSWGIVLYDRGRIPHRQIDAMAADPVLTPLLWPVAQLAATLSVSDRYHVFASA
jgi:SAM-dependent methyltransferase